MINFQNKPSADAISKFIGKHILDISQFTKDELETIMNMAAYYEKSIIAKKRLYDMDGKIMASLFFEPSTRTRLSFESAMHRLGGNVVTVAETLDAQISSSAKGETLRDTIQVISSYADVIVSRSPVKDSRIEASKSSAVPFINAGDGAGQHPTQALLDMYTIFKEKTTPDGLTIALIGDLKNGRTVHSLSDALALYKTKIILVSPEELKMPESIVAGLQTRGVEVEETNDMQYACSHSDVVYMTRVQRERFADLTEYEKVKDMFILTGEHLNILKEDAIILHPLPRLNEIAVEVDHYKGAAYFRQAANGLFVRMALLAMITDSVQ